MSKLNEKDLDLLLKGNIPSDSPSVSYTGGTFGQNINDFVQINVYDVNNNYLESTILSTDDWEFNTDVGVSIKTGTVLRKMGYDRGKFKVKYNFLRKKAGSWETLLVDTNGDIYTDQFDSSNPSDRARIGRDLFIKENKYFVHEISPSRTELRLAPQNIQYSKYNNDFIRLKNVRERITSEQYGPLSFHQPNGGSDDFLNTNDLKLVVESQQLPTNILTNGKLIIPNAFITSHIIPSENTMVDDQPFSSTEVDSEEMQARFFIDPIHYGQELQLMSGVAGDGWGDKSLSVYQGQFKQYDTEESLESQLSDDLRQTSVAVDSGGTESSEASDDENYNGTISKIRYCNWQSYKTPTFATNQDTNPPHGIQEYSIVRLRSNSFKPNNLPTTYTWTVSGYYRNYDEEDEKEYIPVTGTTKKITDADSIHWEQEQFKILNIDDPEYADWATASDDPDISTIEGRANRSTSLVNTATTIDSTNGSVLDLMIFGKKVYYSIKLSINNNANQSSMVFLPACIRTAKLKPS